jgi:hypothetical protein
VKRRRALAFSACRVLKTFERFDCEYLRLQYKQKLQELEEEIFAG